MILEPPKRMFTLFRLGLAVVLLAASLITLNQFLTSILLITPTEEIFIKERYGRTIPVTKLSEYKKQIDRITTNILLRDKSALLTAQLQLYLAIETNNPLHIETARKSIETLIYISPTTYHPYVLNASFSSHFETNDNFNTTLQQSILVGTLEEWAQLQLIRLIVKNWGSLTPETKTNALKVVQQSTKNQFTKRMLIREIAKTGNITPFLYLFPDPDERLKITELRRGIN